jgi:hypothetical protein
MRFLPLALLLVAACAEPPPAAEPPGRATPVAEASGVEAAAPAAEADPGVTCYTSDRYHVAGREGENGLGTDFLVRPLPPDEPPPCAYAPGSDTWEIPNEWAEYFFALEGAFLVLDSGTGPDPRGLQVWDLDARQIAFGAAASDLWMPAPDTLAYWAEVSAPPDAASCPERAAYEARGLGAALEQEIRLALAGLVPRPTGAVRCSARQ